MRKRKEAPQPPLGTLTDDIEVGTEPAPDVGGEHMATFRAPELAVETGGDDEVIPVDETGEPIPADNVDAETVVEQISKEAFFVVFRHSFGMPGMFAPLWRPLAIQPEEMDMARDASDAIYELLEIYAPFALTPQSETFGRIARALPFIMAKVMIVRMILDARRADRSAPKQVEARQGPEFRTVRTKPPETQPESANENYIPTGPSPLGWMAQGGAA